MKFRDINLGDRVKVYKNGEWGFVTVVGKSPPQTLIVERDDRKRHFVTSGCIRPKEVEDVSD